MYKYSSGLAYLLKLHLQHLDVFNIATDFSLLSVDGNYPPAAKFSSSMP